MSGISIVMMHQGICVVLYTGRARGHYCALTVEGVGAVARKWFALKTFYQRERKVSLALEDLRVKNIYPVQRTEYRRLEDGLLCAKIKPLFPQVLFARFDWLDRLSVMQVRGFHSFLGYNSATEMPVDVPPHEIEYLCSLLTEVNGLEYVLCIKSSSKMLRRKSKVKVMAGPFRDQMAIVKDIDGSRVQVTLSILGREFDRIEMRRNLLAA